MNDYTAILTEDVKAMLYAVALGVVVVALATFAVITTAKHVGRALSGPGVWDRRVPKALLRLAPLVVGPVLALVPGVFEGFPAPLAALFGLIAGFNAEGIYNKVKAWLPGMVLSKEHRATLPGE